MTDSQQYDERTKQSEVAAFAIAEVAEEKHYKQVNMKIAKPEGLTDEEFQTADAEEVEIWQKEYP